MAVVTCNKNDCLNHGIDVCRAQRIRITDCSTIPCDCYITAEEIAQIEYEKKMFKL